VKFLESLEKIIRLSLLSRRKVLGSLFVSFLTIVLKPLHSALSSSYEATTPGVFHGPLLKGDFQFLSPYQATVLDEITALIIPSDAYPGAREAGVVFKLDNHLANAKRSRNLYRTGVQLLDYLTQEVYGKESFLHLDEEGKKALLQMAESGKSTATNTEQNRSGQTAQSFFLLVKREAFEAFYTAPEGWQSVGYQGPPQWKGNRDYHRCAPGRKDDA